MRFAMATNDSHQSVLEALLREGWQLAKLFVSPGDWIDGTELIIARAIELGVPVQNSPIRPADLAELGKNDCSALVVACYRWKIPDWQNDLQYAINFHPSPLPTARGPYPIVRAILDNHRLWGVTCHKINPKLDQGDIIDTEYFAIDPDERHESLRLKIQMAAGRLATRITHDFPARVAAAVRQEGGSYWGYWTDQERTIDFAQPVEAIGRQIRAFGLLGCLATINDVTIHVRHAKVWREPHAARPGSVVHSSNLSMVVAAVDGLVAITEWSFHAPGTITSNVPR